MTKPLTPNQRAALDYIIRFKRENGGDSPTVREIVGGTAYTTNSAVHHTLCVLERLGYIERPTAYKSRRIVVVGGQWEYHEEAS